LFAVAVELGSEFGFWLGAPAGRHRRDPVLTDLPPTPLAAQIDRRADLACSADEVPKEIIERFLLAL
jgi:hypothetical protein